MLERTGPGLFHQFRSLCKTQAIINTIRKGLDEKIENEMIEMIENVMVGMIEDGWLG
jgi:predicted RNA binding protein with dsRBD fold (UPF0201 family)